MTRRPIQTLLPLLFLLGLAGCFTSSRPLIGASEAVFPFATLTYGEQGSDEKSTFVRQGKAYVLQLAPKGRHVELLFKKLPSGHYLAQMKGDQKQGPVYLYALLKVDLDGKTAEAFKVVAGKADLRPGLRDCPERTLCVDDLAAYVALGEAAVAAGEEPDTIYEFKATK